MNINIIEITQKIKSLLSEISPVTPNTQKNDNTLSEISCFENPLNPSLLSYCFDVILGFDVHYRIAEKVNYIIEFDYKGTYARVGHYKLSYRVHIDEHYRNEIISLFAQALPLLEELFAEIGKQALLDNVFSMKNEAPDYFTKLSFYEQRIEQLEKRKKIIQKKCHGQHDITLIDGTYTHMRPKCRDYLHMLTNEITYDIEAYIDVFFSSLEHILTLLYPFVISIPFSKSYYKDYIRSTRWSWDVKIHDVCGNTIPQELFNELRRIKEIYRNHNAHGGFSREMMAYVQIPNFGRYPMYIGKEYLKGFIDEYSDSVSYDMYMHAKTIFNDFWAILDNSFKIPMMFVRSGLAIPVDTTPYLTNVKTAEDAEWLISKLWYDIDNQSNMDW